MVVSDTVHLVGEVHGEGDAVQALVADNASEAARVIGLPHRLQDLARKAGKRFRLPQSQLPSYTLYLLRLLLTTSNTLLS